MELDDSNDYNTVETSTFFQKPMRNSEGCIDIHMGKKSDGIRAGGSWNVLTRGAE